MLQRPSTSSERTADHGIGTTGANRATSACESRASLRRGWWLGLGIVLLLVRPVWAEESEPTGFAVVELFTSEGCSSCPPADQLLSELHTSAEKSGSPIYVLSYHVDYWDQLGWEDPYGTTSSTSRQYDYGRLFKDNRVYTPQMVVNGTTEFVGSDRKRAQAEIKRALQSPEQIGLTATAKLSADRIELTTRADSAPADCNLIAALVQRKGTQQVTAGENSRKSLAHVNIVHTLHSTALTAAGEQRTKFALPKELGTTDVEVIVFVQHKDGAIRGATRCSIENGDAKQ